ncbi:hypothetical protein BH10ACI3_BH10ACI3_24080 [soil metagenome]
MLKHPFAIACIVVFSFVVIGGIGGLIYYQSLKSSPQYSLALLVDAAKRDDKAGVEEIIDIDAVVDDFMPQVTDKAIELYGRGLPPEMLRKVATLAEPLMPAVKERAKAELPRVIRERTGRFGDVPFFAMVLGADRYLNITVSGDTAVVKSKIPEHPLEMKMHRTGSRWKIVGVTDENLATSIASKIGQEIVAVAMYGSKDAAERFGIGNLSDLLKQAEELVR